MATNEEYTEEEQEGGDDIQDTDFSFLSCFGLIKWLINRIYSPLLLLFYYFMMPVWPWISLDRGGSWSWILSTSSSQCHSKPVLVITCKPPNTVKYILKVKLMAWKQGWICGRRWMWFQCSMDNFPRYFTWWCGYFSLLLVLPSGIDGNYRVITLFSLW